MSSPSRDALNTALHRAYDFASQHIDLSGCCYGKPHWPGPYIHEPHSYYYFLAGFVALLRCTRVLELGAHYGGSIFAIARAIVYSGDEQLSEIVTVDIRRNNSDAFRANPLVKRLIGNCLADDIVQQAREAFSGPIDLMFVDVTHDYEVTKCCIDKYVPIVSPRLLIIDDIRLNASMAKVWAELSAAYGDCAIDITDISHREQEVGFGLLIPRST